MATVTAEPVRLPPAGALAEDRSGHRADGRMQGVIAAMARRYGSAFTFNLPIWGRTVVISDPVLVKDLFSTNSDLVERPTDLVSVGEVSVPDRRSALPATNSSSAGNWWFRRFTASGCELRADHRRRGAARDRDLA